MNELRLTGTSLGRELKIPDNNRNIIEIDDLVIGETPQEVVPLKYKSHDKFFPKSKDIQLIIKTFFLTCTPNLYGLTSRGCFWAILRHSQQALVKFPLLETPPIYSTNTF